MLLIYTINILNFKERIAKTESDISDAIRLKNNSKNLPSPESPSIAQKIDDLNEMRDKLRKSLDYPIDSFKDDFWKKLHSFIMNNWDELSINGNFAISFEISYIYCVYIILFIPGEFGFFIPAKYKYFIPKKVYNVKLVSDFLNEIDLFLKYIKIKSKKEFLITFYIGRQKSLKEDFKMLLDLPNVIMKDPIVAIRNFLAFKIWTDGYEDYKKNMKGEDKIN
ncbi:hypothetical protein DMUE_2341 [Dictyocoela muelleri]|nr:hypothetical protein DMUE_2341 [Dictyocoela muelleri]